MDPEETVRTLYGTTDWFKIGKGVQQGCLLSPCLFNLYAEHIMRNAKLDLEKEGESEIKLPTFAGSQGNSRKTSTSVSLTTLKL